MGLIRHLQLAIALDVLDARLTRCACRATAPSTACQSTPSSLADTSRTCGWVSIPANDAASQHRKLHQQRSQPSGPTRLTDEPGLGQLHRRKAKLIGASGGSH